METRAVRTRLATFLAVLLSAVLAFMAIEAANVKAAFAEEADGNAALVEEEQQDDADDFGSDEGVLPEPDAEEPDSTEEAVVEEDDPEPEAGEVAASARDGPVEEPAEPAVAARAVQVSCTVTFYGDVAQRNPSIIARKLVTAPAGSVAVVDVSDVSAAPAASGAVFEGWSYDGMTARDSITVDPSAGDVDLYPKFSQGHWLRFVAGDHGSGAAPVSSIYVGAQDGELASLPTTVRAGYRFDGWFAGSSTGGHVEYGARVTDGAGSVLAPGALRDELRFGDVELFAAWTGEQTTYRVATWLENPDDDGFAYASSYVFGDDEGEIALSGSMTDVTDVPAIAGFTPDAVEQRLIAGDGTTVVNLYYHRNFYDLTFYDGRSAGAGVIEKLTVRAKYGADIRDRWPRPGSAETSWSNAWYVSPDSSNLVFVTGIEVMPLGGASFYAMPPGRYAFNTVYRVQDVDGSDTFSDFIDEPFSGDSTPSTTADDYMAIPGFTVNAASERDAESIRDNPIGDSLATHDPLFKASAAVGTSYAEGASVAGDDGVVRKTLYFYYLRCKYDVLFVENGGAGVENVTGVYYDAPLAGRAPAGYVAGETQRVAEDGATYTFAGWYANEDFIGDAFDFDEATMPAGNVMLYAKWVPAEYLVQINPAGGEFASAGQSTYFRVAHGKAIGEVGVSRDYAPDPGGGFAYEYDAYAGGDGFGAARYVLAPTDYDGERYRFEPGAYTLFGWYRVVGGEATHEPYDFASPVIDDVSIIAKWRAAGTFDIAYNPIADVGDDRVSGEIDTQLDEGYADLSPTFVMGTPTGISSESGRDYTFAGWRVVSGFGDGAETLVDGLYREGDLFVIDSDLARYNTIHLQAVYELVGDDGGGQVYPEEVGPGEPDEEADGNAAEADDSSRGGSETKAPSSRQAVADVLPLTGDEVLQLAVGAGGLALIALAVALLARVMRKKRREIQDG